MKKYKTGGVANPNAKVTVQKVAGSKGVGATKSTKATADKKATGRTGGGNKSATVEPKSKKKNVK
jgi:hypothetical protein